MKNLKFALFFLIGISVFSCATEEVNPNAVQSKTVDQPLFQQEQNSGEDLIEIGFIQDGEFEFSVTEDKLSEVYTYNIEINLEESGVLEEADVISSASEDEPGYFVVLSGSAGEEGSASIYAEVHTVDDEDVEGLVHVLISPKPVLAGICYSIWCGKCRQSDLTPTNRFCKCLSGAFPPPCPYVQDPTIIWIQ